MLTYPAFDLSGIANGRAQAQTIFSAQCGGVESAIIKLPPAWEPDAAVRKKILVDNPARLYGYPT
jgi:hypothetical protein